MPIQPTPPNDPAPNDGTGAIPLTELRVGERGRMLEASLTTTDRHLLDALGLSHNSSLRLVQRGDPWIVQVRATRIGLAKTVAECIQVVREPGVAGSV